MGLSPDKDIFVQILAVFFQVSSDEDEPEVGEEGLVEPVVLVRSMSGRTPMNAFDDFSCIIITSKQTVNMPVVEVKFDNDDNEVQGDTLLGELPITFQTDSSGSWNIELDATKLTSDALPPVGSIDYVNDIFSSHRRMRHASVCVAPRTMRSTSVKCARCAWIPISNSSTKTSAMTIAAPITKWSV